MKKAGIDIGTSSIAFVAIDSDTGNVLYSKSCQNDSNLPNGEKLQSPERILEIVEEILDEFFSRHDKLDVLGLSGQMHGILYVDEKGSAVSPLYTWEYDKGRDEARYLEEWVSKTSVGFGLNTHYYLQKRGLISQKAVSFVDIASYIAMKLSKREKAIVSLDMAASFGCFDLETKSFCERALSRAGVDIDYLPEVSEKHKIIGHTSNGIPVITAMGDNQASFLGSVGVSYTDTLLINIGTGSQVSFPASLIAHLETEKDIELRPLSEYSYLLVGSSLCGGRAYSLLENFYRSIKGVDEECYDQIYGDAYEFIHRHGIKRAWDVRTTFSGTRREPEEKGSISNIDADNFTPGAFAAGLLIGIVDELYQYYRKIESLTGRKAKRLVGSGNGIVKNKLMQSLIEYVFSMKLELSEHEEQAAYGACLNAERIVGDRI